MHHGQRVIVAAELYETQQDRPTELSDVKLTDYQVTLLRRPLPPTVPLVPKTLVEKGRPISNYPENANKSLPYASQLPHITPLINVDNNNYFTSTSAKGSYRIAPKPRPTPDLNSSSHNVESLSLVGCYVQNRYVNNVKKQSPFNRVERHVTRKRDEFLSTSSDNKLSCAPAKLSLYPNSNLHPSAIYPEFTFQDFVLKLSEKDKLPMHAVTRIMYSRRNYETIQKWLLEQCMPHGQDELHTVELRLPNEVQFRNRIPRRHLLIELAAELREQISELTGKKMKSKIIRIPQYKPDSRLTDISSAPDTEIFLYEDSSYSTSVQRSRESMLVIETEPHAPSGIQSYGTFVQRSRESMHLIETELPGKDSVLSASRTKFFQGEERSSSPFIMTDPNVISPAEVSILNSLMNGGTSLSLKAHFLSGIPDIAQLMDTLVYLNLSYNCLDVLPTEVLDIHNLAVLKLRNNPLIVIPVEISRLCNLQTLILSFCLLEDLPSELFRLKLLKILDVAYNKLLKIPDGLGKLENLEELMVEGNQLKGLPVSVLRLKRLRSLCVVNNFMHPLFWEESGHNNPQTLKDLSCLVIRTSMQGMDVFYFLMK